MMRLELEFIHRRRMPWFGLGFLMLSAMIGTSQIVALTEVWTIHQNQLERIDQLEGALKNRQHNARQAQSNISPALAQHWKEQAKMTDALRYQWTRVLATIEKTNLDDVAILSFNHDQATGGTQLSVEALNVSSVIRFVEKMNDLDETNRWYLANYQVQLQNAPVTLKAAVLNK